jgi:hypothetical protein
MSVITVTAVQELQQTAIGYSSVMTCVQRTCKVLP